MDDVITKLGTISESLIRVEGKVDQIKETVSLHDAVLFGNQRDKQFDGFHGDFLLFRRKS